MGTKPGGGSIDDLIARGWRQGSFVSAIDGMSVPFLRSTDGGSVIADAEPVRSRERLVIASHACDLARPASTEPYAEILVCRREERSRLKGSPRTFVIDRESGLVVNAHRRILVAKAALAGLDPEPWPSTDARLHDFQRWLGERYDRVGFSDFAQAEAVAPLRQVYANITREDVAVADALSRALREVRLVVNERTKPASALVLIIIWPSITPRLANAVEQLASEFAKGLDPNTVRLVTAPKIAPYQAISAHEFLLTQAISMIS